MSTNHRHLYNSARWKQLRGQQLRTEPLCRMHRALGKYVLATVVDHVHAHRGDEGRFYDEDNLQSLCKGCHDGHKQAQEHHADGLLRGAGHDGRPLDLAHPWHQPARGVGGQISAGAAAKTGPRPSLAKCQNGRGGLSA